LGAELRELAIVRHAAEQVSDDAAQLLELVARLRGICQGIDRLRALLDLLLQVGRVLGELLDLARVFLDRREGVGVGTRVLCARGRNSEYSCNERNAERTPDIAQARHGADHGHLPRQMRMVKRSLASMTELRRACGNVEPRVAPACMSSGSRRNLFICGRRTGDPN